MFKLASNEFIAMTMDGDIIIGTPGDSSEDSSLPRFTGRLAEDFMNEFPDRVVELTEDGFFPVM
jgi:hypothetical protein